VSQFEPVDQSQDNARRENHAEPVADRGDTASASASASASAHDEDEDAVARLVATSSPPEVDMTALLDDMTRQADAEGLVDVAWAVTDSPVGQLVLAATPAGVVKINFGGEDEMVDDLARRISPRVLRAPGRLDVVRRELDEYFAGQRHEFDVPLDWQLSRGFRRIALDELARGVPFGHTVSYKQLAEQAGSPKASRAIGSAMATNPIPIVVPCHRVLRTGGDLGGYGGGLDAKRWLLHHEGALLA
jgi:methylated-DNA-[protein]-cysteine S-methyltransferase